MVTFDNVETCTARIMVSTGTHNGSIPALYRFYSFFGVR